MGSEKRYASIARKLVEGIASNRFPVGSVLPTELELAKRFGVSRSTVRSALQELQQLGLVSRRRNVGTRVESKRPVQEEIGYTHSLRTVDDVLQYAAETQRIIQEIAEEVADDALAARLKCRPGLRWLRVSSIRVDSRKPSGGAICWTDVYVDYAYAGIVRDQVKNYRDAISSLIEERGGRHIAEIFQVIRAAGVSPHMVSALKVEPNSHALEITRHYRDASGTSVLISISTHPESQFAYTLLMRRQKNANS